MPSRSAPQRSADYLRLVAPPAVATTVAATVAAKPKAAAAARTVGDWVWHGLGAGVATASAGFATYAMIFSTGEVVPSGNFNLFARYDRLYTSASARHPAPASAAPRGPETPPQRTDTAGLDAVDFSPTGSVSTAEAGTAPRPRRAPDGPALPNFTLRDVFDGKALVESRSSLSVVKPGSVLDGAGEVLSIEKRGEHWVVLTANGVIAGQKR